MPKNLKRYLRPRHLHFMTFSCHRRLPLLGTIRVRNLFVQALGKIRERYGFRLVGYTFKRDCKAADVMPDHVALAHERAATKVAVRYTL